MITQLAKTTQLTDLSVPSGSSRAGLRSVAKTQREMQGARIFLPCNLVP